jgi:hypothetical protein
MMRFIDALETSRTGTLVVVLCALVLVPAFLIRLHPTTSESFAYDAIISQEAAQKGVVANALDRSDLLYDRRGHPPLLSYIIVLNNRIFGSDELGERVFSMIAGSLCCLAVALSVLLILGRFGGRLPAALFGGLMLALLPVHLYVSRTANWDAVYSLFATCALLSLALHISRPGLGRLLLAGVFGSLALLTCELGSILAPAFAAALWVDLRRRAPKRVAREWALWALVSIGLTFLLWPAGIIKLDLARALLFRIRDNAAAVPGSHWTSLYGILARQSPAFAAASLLGAGTLVGCLAAARKAAPETRAALRTSLAMMLPFAVYAATVFAVNTRQHLVYVHHIADMMPALAVLFSCAAGVGAGLSARRAGRIAIAAGCLLLLALSIPSAASTDPDVVGPQEHPGFLGVRDYLEKRPGARTYYYYSQHMKFYLPNADIEGEAPRGWTAEQVAHAKRTPYDFVVTDRSLFDDAYPDIASLARALAPEYRLAHTVLHRRTGRPVAWIFSRS